MSSGIFAAGHDDFRHFHLKRVLELRGDFVERAGHAGAEAGHRADDDDGDQGRDQSVFDRGHGALVGLESQRRTNVINKHVLGPFSLTLSNKAIHVSSGFKRDVK